MARPILLASKPSPESDPPIHPLAEAFPEMRPAESALLVADMIVNGFVGEPITLDQNGRVVEGRNRLKACREAKVDPKFETVNFASEEELRRFIFRKNAVRRQLNNGQLAIAAATLFPETSKGGRGRKNPCELQGFDAALLSHARQIVKKRPDLAAQVRVGAMPFEAAWASVKGPSRRARASDNDQPASRTGNGDSQGKSAGPPATGNAGADQEATTGASQETPTGGDSRGSNQETAEAEGAATGNNEDEERQPATGDDDDAATDGATQEAASQDAEALEPTWAEVGVEVYGAIHDWLRRPRAIRTVLWPLLNALTDEELYELGSALVPGPSYKRHVHDLVADTTIDGDERVRRLRRWLNEKNTATPEISETIH